METPFVSLVLLLSFCAVAYRDGVVAAQDGAIVIDAHWEDYENQSNNNGNIKDPLNTVVLQSPAITNWGSWGKFVHCSMTHSYVTGFQLKVEEKESGIDNTAVNGINLSCGIPEQKEIERISSAKAPWGKSRTRIFCSKGPAVGFQLKVQMPQGSKVDDAATVNVKMICANGEILEGYDERGDYYVDTLWSDPVKCPDKTAVCGMQTQVEFPKGWLADDTSLNNIRIKCCPLPPEDTENHQEEQSPTTQTMETVTESIQGGNVTDSIRQTWQNFKEWHG